jgi:hypothetical protein
MIFNRTLKLCVLMLQFGNDHFSLKGASQGGVPLTIPCRAPRVIRAVERGAAFHDRIRHKH